MCYIHTYVLLLYFINGLSICIDKYIIILLYIIILNNNEPNLRSRLLEHVNRKCCSCIGVR